MGRLVLQVGLKAGGIISVACQVVLVCVAISKQHVHDATRQRPVTAGSDTDKQISLSCRAVAIGIDHNQSSVALPPGLSHMSHDVDLSAGRVGAPQNNQI